MKSIATASGLVLCVAAAMCLGWLVRGPTQVEARPRSTPKHVPEVASAQQPASPTLVKLENQPELERAKQRHIEAHEQALRAHAAEAFDRTWGPATAATFREDLGVLKSTSAKLLDVDCRTTLCVARIQWPSYGDARKQFTNVFMAPYRINCAKEVTLPEPSNPARPYTASIVFDCHEAR